MKIHCPCDMTAEAKVVNGIVMYQHDDGTSCKLLNRFYTDKCASFAWSMSKKAIRNNDFKSFNAYMCKDTKDVMDELVDYIALANKQELIEVLVFLFRTSDVKFEVQRYVAEKLIDEYGRSAYVNLQAIRSKNFARDLLLFGAMFPKISRSKMINIVNDVNIDQNSAKQNIVNDLARSFLLDKAMRDTSLKNTIKSFSR